MSFGVRSKRYGRRRSSLILKPEFVDKLETNERNRGAAIGWITTSPAPNNKNNQQRQQYKKRGRPSRYSKQKRKVYQKKHQKWVKKEAVKKTNVKPKGKPKESQFWWKNDTNTTNNTNVNTNETKNSKDSDTKPKEAEPEVTTLATAAETIVHDAHVKQDANDKKEDSTKANEKPADTGNDKAKEDDVAAAVSNDATDASDAVVDATVVVDVAAENEKKSENNESDEKSNENGLLPVTVLTGFESKAKQTILKTILTNVNLNVKIGIILNNMKKSLASLVNVNKEKEKNLIDKKLHNDNIVVLKNGNICCEYYQNNDMYDAFVKLLKESNANGIVLESPAMIPTLEIAESFAYAAVEDGDKKTAASDKKDDEEKDDDVTKLETVCNVLSSVAVLDTMVSVIDCDEFDGYINSVATFGQKFPKDKSNSSTDDNDRDGEEVDNNVCELVINQIEYANVIVIGGGDGGTDNNESDGKSDPKSSGSIGKFSEICNILNRKCKIVTDYSNVDGIESLFKTSIFDFGEFESKERKYYDYLTKSLNVASKLNSNENKSKHLQWFKYSSRKPFDPWKLYLLIKSQMLENVIIANGILWIATQNETCFEWSQYGLIISFEEKCPWLFGCPGMGLTTLNDDGKTKDSKGRRRSRVVVLTQEKQDSLEKKYQRKRKDSLFVGTHGDRRQEIVFIGYKNELNSSELLQNLNACLISDDDFKNKSVQEWKEMQDPFQREFDSENDDDESSYEDDDDDDEDSSEESQISDID